MECPKCHKIIRDDSTVCPHCRKVLVLRCPNCNALSDSSVCEHCGYVILTKCNKCGKTVATNLEKCPKCGFEVSKSIKFQECEIDEFAVIIIQFEALDNIRKALKNRDLYSKFYKKLKNLLTIYLNNIEGCKILFKDSYYVNFNVELSFPTSAQKAVRAALKIANGFVSLNAKLQQEFGFPLNIKMMILKKGAEDLLKPCDYQNNVKLLNIGKTKEKYLKGIQIVLDQHVRDVIANEYKTDSLYSIDVEGQSLMLYDLILEGYLIPPSEAEPDMDFQQITDSLKKKAEKIEKKEPDVLSGDNIFEINAKCTFKKVSTENLINVLQDKAIISICSDAETTIPIGDLCKYYESNGKRVLICHCSESMNYTTWGFFEQLLRECCNLPVENLLLTDEQMLSLPRPFMDFLLGNIQKTSSPEDARFRLMDLFIKFLKSMTNCVVIVEDYEFLDDTSLQTLKLYFDKFNRINVPFVFTTTSKTSLHCRYRELLRTAEYVEYTLQPVEIEYLMSDLKDDVSDFIKSFYYEKIIENYSGSLMYFRHAIKYLYDKDVLVSLDGKLIIKNTKSVILPADLAGLVKARLKHLSNNPDASLILAYSLFFGARLDFALLELLNIQNISEAAKVLCDAGFAVVHKDDIHISNYSIVKPVIQLALKKEVEDFLGKNILAKFNMKLNPITTISILGKLAMFNEEYLILWRNSKYAIRCGDYDAYLKNCLGLLEVAEHITKKIPQEELDNNKKEIFNNILMSLYAYSPEKIYSVEKFLLDDAIKNEDDETVVKLSNLMLQGALLTSNYTEAQKQLYNIYRRMSNPSLLIDGAINMRFLLFNLINIEILFNVGDVSQCCDIAKDLLSILKPEILDKIRPESFSLGSFTQHLGNTFTIVAFAKLFKMDNDIKEFFVAVKNAIGIDIPDKDCILAIYDYLAGKEFAISDSEEATPFSKVIYLILLEFSKHRHDYKSFAQNIYRAKLLANDIHQPQLELICELLIADAYMNVGMLNKASKIMSDILKTSEEKGMFNIVMLSRYFISKLKLKESKTDEAFMFINDALAILQKNNNQSKIHYALFEKLFVDTAAAYNVQSVDMESELKKLEIINENECLSRILA